MVKPIFLLSLPRSGSTLVQRVLMGHPAIASVSEPWLMLPLAYLLPKGEDNFHEAYDHRHAQQAIRDLAMELPGGISQFKNEIRNFVLEIYSKLSGEGVDYFVDKTPRYYLIIPDLIEMFPEARFIILYRNPLAVLASIVRTWGNGRFRPMYRNEIDLLKGPHLLAEAGKQLGSNAVVVRYEEFVERPDTEIKRILEYLDLQPVDGIGSLGTVNQELSGSLGDQVGVAKFKEISRASTESWRGVLNTRARRRFALQYIDKLGEDVLNDMGYSPSDLERALREDSDELAYGVRDTLDSIRMRIYQAAMSEMTRRVLRKVLIPGNLRWKHRS